MEYLKIALLAVVALLLLFFLIDRNREPQQILAFMESMKQTQSDLAAQQDELREALKDLRTGGATVVSDNSRGQQQAVTVVDPHRDGKVKLGVNFLLPVDDSHYNRKNVGGTLKYFVAAPKAFNLIVENSATKKNLYDLIHNGLCAQDPKHPQLWSESLAVSCIISDDYTTYTFQLRDNVYWHIPKIASQSQYSWLNKKVKLTARDFQAYYDTVMNPDVECPQLKTYYEDVESITALSELTLQVKWKKKVYTSLSTGLAMKPLPWHVYAHDADGQIYSDAEYGVVFNKHWFDKERQAIGVGAYTLDQYIPDKIVSYKRNKNYWGKFLHFDRIEWDGEVRKPEAQWVSFQNGDVHFGNLPPTKFKSEVLDHKEDRFAAQDDKNAKAGRTGVFGWEKTKSSSYSYIGWNMRRPLFADKHVRQALTHAFPKQRIINEVYYGLGQPQVANVHPDSVYYNDKLVDYTFDLEKAKQLLDQAGWIDSDDDGIRDKEVNGKRLKFEFILKYYANSVEWDSTLIIYKNQLRKIGIVMKPTNYEWKELLRVYEDKDFAAVSGGWRFGLEVDFKQVWHSESANKPRSSNHCGFINKRADEIAEKLRETFDQDERIRLAQEFQAIVYEEQPYTFFRSGESIFIWQNKNDTASKAKPLHGVIEGFDLYHPLRNRSQLLWHFE